MPLPLKPAWTELDRAETDRLWDDFYERFRFRPSIDSFPGIDEPASSITFDLPDYGDAAALDAAFLDAAMPTVPGPLYVLDWQHTCYRFSPGLAGAGDWPVSVYPDGDYHIFLTEDLASGTFGHPWERTLCVFGEPLMASLGAVLAERLTMRRQRL